MRARKEAERASKVWGALVVAVGVLLGCDFGQSCGGWTRLTHAIANLASPEIGLRWKLGTASRLARSGGVYHVPRVREADSISATMGFDYCPCLVIGCVTSPVSLQFQQNLNPGGDSRAGRLHPT